MGKKSCILGNNCPNKIAKRNFSYLLSDDESELNHTNLKENCVFCGSYTIKAKKRSDTSSPWSNSSNEDNKMKRPIATEIDSLCGMRSTSKKKKEDDMDDNFDYLLKKVLKRSESSRKKDDDDDDDDEELSDSGVKLDYDSPSCSGVNVKKNNEINSFKSQATSFKFQPPSEPFQQNGLNKDTFKLSAQSNFKISNSTFSSPIMSRNDESPLMSGNNSSASDFSPVRKRKNIFRIASPVSEASSFDSPFNKDNSMDESDPFEFDSDHESKKPIAAVPIKDKDSVSEDEQKKPVQSFHLWSKTKILDSDDEDRKPMQSLHLWSKKKILESDDEDEKPKSSLQLLSKGNNFDSDDEQKSSIKSSNFFPKDKDLDSDNEQGKSTQSVSPFSRDKDLEEAGPSSRPDVAFEDDNDPLPTSSRQNARFMNLSYLPKHKVERLLYKSLKLQFLNEFSSSSDEDDIWLTKEVKKDRKRKRCKMSAPVKDKMFKSNLKIGSGFYKWKKRRRTHNYLSDEDSNLTFESTNDASDVDDDSDNSANTDEDDNTDVQTRRCSYQDHDYSTSEFHKIAEANIDNLAFETEKLNWDDTVMIDDATMNSAIITLDDSPQRFELPLLEPAEGVITLDESDTSTTAKSKSPDKSPNLNNSDHIYCVTEIKLERPESLNCLKQSETAKLSDEPSNDGSDKTEEYNVESVAGPNSNDDANSLVGEKENSSNKRNGQWECAICLEPSSGQEISGTFCGHIFCKDCIESYLVTSAQCPTCRKELDKRQLITLYDMMK